MYITGIFDSILKSTEHKLFIRSMEKFRLKYFCFVSSVGGVGVLLLTQTLSNGIVISPDDQF